MECNYRDNSIIKAIVFYDEKDVVRDHNGVVRIKRKYGKLKREPIRFETQKT